MSMAQRPPKPVDSPWLIPCLMVKDVDEAMAFYAKAFGFQERFKMPGPDGKTAHGEMRYREAAIMLAPEGIMGSPSVSPATSGVAASMSLYIYCDDVDAMFAQATAAGAKAMNPPADMFWGDRMCTIQDTNGYQWCFATNKADFDPTKKPW